MTDKPEQDSERCVPCEIAWYSLVGLGVALIAFIAWDVLTQGQATEVAGKLFAGFKPKLAVVRPIRGQDDDTNSA